MTVRAQQCKVLFISLPIFHAARPIVLALFGLNFLIGVNVVDVQYAQIIIAALGAFAAQHAQDFDFALPVSLTLARTIAVLVPVFLLTIRSAEPRCRGLSTHGTNAVLFPSVGHVAFATAIVSKSFFDKIRHGLKRLSTMFTLSGNARSFSHVFIIHNMQEQSKSTYFAIAKRRIEDAAAQPPLIPHESEPKHEQEALWP